MRMHRLYIKYLKKDIKKKNFKYFFSKKSSKYVWLNANCVWTVKLRTVFVSLLLYIEIKLISGYRDRYAFCSKKTRVFSANLLSYL